MKERQKVALFTRAWIEIIIAQLLIDNVLVALFTRAWIEIMISVSSSTSLLSRPLHEGVD